MTPRVLLLHSHRCSRPGNGIPIVVCPVGPIPYLRAHSSWSLNPLQAMKNPAARLGINLTSR